MATAKACPGPGWAGSAPAWPGDQRIGSCRPAGRQRRQQGPEPLEIEVALGQRGPGPLALTQIGELPRACSRPRWREGSSRAGWLGSTPSSGTSMACQGLGQQVRGAAHCPPG